MPKAPIDYRGLNHSGDTIHVKVQSLFSGVARFRETHFYRSFFRVYSAEKLFGQKYPYTHGAFIYSRATFPSPLSGHSPQSPSFPFDPHSVSLFPLFFLPRLIPMESVPSSATLGGYPDSVDSSPRSRGGESWDEPYPSASVGSSRLRLMCSYGGRIVPRPTDKSLCYLSGETRIVVVDRQGSLADLHPKLSRTLLGGRPFSLKYQLPNEDLDSLISVSTDEDLENSW